MNKSSIPKLPKTIKGLESLLKKKFKILSTDEAVSAVTGAKWYPGDPSLITSKEECPFCKMQFKVAVESDCLGRSVDPDYCPNCSFPNNVAYALSHNKRNKEKKEG